MQIELPNQDFATVHLHDDFDHYLVSQGPRDIDVQVYHDQYPPCLLAAKVYNGQGIHLDTIAQMGLSATPPALTGQEPAALAAFVYAHFDEIYLAITEHRVPDCLQVYGPLTL